MCRGHPDAAHHRKCQRIIVHLRYLADFTRPNITYITGRLGAANHKPTERHLQALKATIRYLSGAKEMGILYPSGQCRPPHLHLLQFKVDESFAGDSQDRKLPMAISITYNGTLISWTSKTSESSLTLHRRIWYISITVAVQHMHLINQMMLQFTGAFYGACTIHCDNFAVCDMTTTIHVTKRRKFMYRRHYLYNTRYRNTSWK